MATSVFISYSSKDQETAQRVCAALEDRGLQCWISCRNIPPGANFQEAIVRAIRSARVMVLVFSGHANNSDEIKKEVALANRSRLAIIPLRIEEVMPDEAFDYEFAIRQWIDLFVNWDWAVEQVALQIAQIADDGGAIAVRSVAAPPARASAGSSRAAPPPPQRRRFRLALWLPLAIASLAVAVVAFKIVQEDHAYRAAQGNPDGLRSYLADCTVCLHKAEARSELDRAGAASREERAYAAAQGNLDALRAYVATCTVCAHKMEASAAINHLETAAREERAYRMAQGNLAALRAYVTSCTTCAHMTAASTEIDRLQTTDREERAYAMARGNLAALRDYVATCAVCQHKPEATAQIASLEAAQRPPPAKPDGMTAAPPSAPDAAMTPAFEGRVVDALDPRTLVVAGHGLVYLYGIRVKDLGEAQSDADRMRSRMREFFGVNGSIVTCYKVSQGTQKASTSPPAFRCLTKDKVDVAKWAVEMGLAETDPASAALAQPASLK